MISTFKQADTAENPFKFSVAIWTLLQRRRDFNHEIPS